MYPDLKAILKELQNNFNLTPVLGAELEFYLSENINPLILSDLIGFNVKPEKGQNQFEVDLPPSQEIILYTEQIELIRQKIIDASKLLGGKATFDPKPFPDDYGNSMHIHLNFLEDDDIEKYASMMCHYTPQYLDIFLPKKEDYTRLDSRFMAPTHICFGGNNRTALIRIPDTLPKRLEHRLASANCDPYLVISAILESTLRGLHAPSMIPNFSKIYGNAFDEQYGLERILG